MVFNLISKKKYKRKGFATDLTNFKEALSIYEKKYNDDKDRTKHLWVHCSERIKYTFFGTFKYKYLKVYCDVKSKEFLEDQTKVDDFINYVKIKADCYLDDEIKYLAIEIYDGRRDPYNQLVEKLEYKREQE